MEGEDVETITAEDAGAGEGVRGLYVTGPNGGARHVLATGLVTLGRGAEAGIVVNDPRVSRAHAGLQVGKEILLSDLGSVNGTFVGKRRLSEGEIHTLADGETFFIGDSALVVRPCALRHPGERRLPGLSAVPERLGGDSVPENVAIVRIRPRRWARRPVVEAVLGELLTAPLDFMVWLDEQVLLLCCAVGAESAASHVEGEAIRKLGSWSVAADVSVRVLSAARIVRAGEGLRALLSEAAPLTLVRGQVLLEDPAMKALEQTVLRVAKTGVSVLVLGETGAGKDVVAAMLHELSPRASAPFLALNCASLPEALLESELFGYERGAFTGAASAKAGLLESAHGGSIFLDELGDLPLPLQAKLLRVIESHEVTRLGALKPRSIDVRFIAATNRDLVGEVASGRFRQDLYYRLNSVTVTVPPLRARPSDIEPLARLFLEAARDRFATGAVCFSPAALAALAAHGWPGNVRELKSTVERGALLAGNQLIEPRDLGLPAPDAGPLLPSVRPTSPNPAPPALEASPELERERIVQALDACGGNQSRAAKMLGMSRRTLVRRIGELGLPRPRDAK
ncbi:MAG TPA: sigma 54-interacting transcriptional regulator [Polyangiaceae bacterium]